MAYGHGGVLLDQHHGSRLSYYEASTDDNRLLACAVNSVVIQNLHAGLGRTGREANLLSGKYAAKGSVCLAVYIFLRRQGVFYHALVDMLGQRTEHQDAVDIVILVHLVDDLQELVLADILRQKILFVLYAKGLAALGRASLIGQVVRSFAHADDSQGRIHALFLQGSHIGFDALVQSGGYFFS